MDGEQLDECFAEFPGGYLGACSEDILGSHPAKENDLNMLRHDKCLPRLCWYLQTRMLMKDVVDFRNLSHAISHP